MTIYIFSPHKSSGHFHSRERYLTLTTCPKFEWTIKKKIKPSSLYFYGHSWENSLNVLSYHCPGDWINEETVPESSRYEYHKNKRFPLLEEKVRAWGTSVSQAIQEYIVLFSRRHNEKRSQEGNIPRTQTEIKIPWKGRIWQYLAKLYLHVPFDWTIPLPGIYAKDATAKIWKSSRV